jgi:hypothetical protein
MVLWWQSRHNTTGPHKKIERSNKDYIDHSIIEANVSLAVIPHSNQVVVVLFFHAFASDNKMAGN